MGETGEVVTFWTFEMVKAELVETLVLWRRSPGGGRWPFAGDGPWHLIQRETMAGDYDARGGDLTSSDVPLRPLPLTCDEVERRDGRSEWLAHVEKPDDRRLVVIALAYLAGGRKTVPWRKIKHKFGIPFGEDGLRRRFERALRAICEGLNAAENRR